MCRICGDCSKKARAQGSFPFVVLEFLCDHSLGNHFQTYEDRGDDFFSSIISNLEVNGFVITTDLGMGTMGIKLTGEWDEEEKIYCWCNT